ncbi:hypothetical protein O181_063072 [Austropuccinia psidii MF-1]|uniref:GAG-pre-integrase domain-containing protein n=1 Tax=Austropuccinia psidii MF-1 TaxID=1389203 RepID=A0A9Q3ENV2_9BASI|nr:hypothetical protein [Austropuccinia psidii MF-1]
MRFEQQYSSSFVDIVQEDLWHKSLGHPGNDPLCSMRSPINNLPCLTCDLNKIHLISFTNLFEHASAIFLLWLINQLPLKQPGG